MFLSVVLTASALLFAGQTWIRVPQCASDDTLSVAVVAADKDAFRDTPAPLRVMTAEGISRSGAASLDEALKMFSGVSVKDYGGIGGLKTVSVRNLGSQHTVVVYDGAVISDAMNGSADIGRFNLDNVSSVKVSFGGTSDIFLTPRQHLCAGSLVIETAPAHFGTSPVQAVVRMGVGSFGTYSPYIMYRHRLASGWALSASADYIYSKGNYPYTVKNEGLVVEKTRECSDVSSVRTEIGVSGDMGKSGRVSVKALFNGSCRGLPGSVVYYTDNPQERLWDRNLVTSALWNWEASALWKVRVSAGWTRSFDRYVDSDPVWTEPREDEYLQNEGTASVLVMFGPLKGFSVSAGEDFFVNSLSTTLEDCPFPLRFSSLTSLYACWSHKRLTVNAGAVLTCVRETVRTGEAASPLDRLSPSLSLSCRLSRREDLCLRASVKDGFRMPTFNDLYYARVGNRNLSPEKALQVNLGILWGKTVGRWDWGISLDGFFNRVRDKIVAIPTMFIWKMRNVGLVNMAGADLEARLAVRAASWMDVRCTASYSFNYAVDVTDSGAKNYAHQIPYTPLNSGSANLSVCTPWVSLSYILSACGERYSAAQNIPENRLEPYADHSLSLFRDFSLGRSGHYGLRVSAQARNLGGRNYEIVRYYPMPGRNWRIEMKFTFK
ncbi:MAG: TonB-dependent receptor plug domain-containing protein [Candidatus Cryptobacteroides sp.]